ncbi:ABC transporter substrate-binding protein [Aggregatilinea lenta]|uniref:ABC transporter substrate-binding protein n=1 Tax=Aggregatilinea lenta TaxID=913108 RepID=UPI000E5C231B|nr:sugar ABC transporter substrate-binding protein [Aggregatilinea lenta]
MRRTNRHVAVALITILLISAFALPVFAQGDEGDATIQAEPCAEPGDLTMWVWDENWAAIIGDAIDQWTADYCAGASVDLQVQPWGQYWDLLKTSASGGDMPDVFNMSQDRFFFYADNDAVLDLQPYWDQYGVDTTVWGTGLIDPYRWGEAQDLYAGPVNWDTIAIMYNKDMFDAAGVEYPTADWTWDDFAEKATALTNPEADQYGALVYMEYQAGYPNWIAATGTTPVVNAERTECTLDDEGSLEALNFLRGLLDEGAMPTVSTVGGSSADDAFSFFASGKVAMVTAGSWKLPDAVDQLTFNWDVVQLPKNPTTERSRSILHAVGYVASARTENPDLAANLILYLVSDEGAKFFAEGSGVSPANPNPDLQQIWVDSFGDADVNIQAYIDAMQDSQGVTVFDEIWDAMNSELVVQIFDLGVPVEDAVADTCAFIDTQLEAQ